MIATWVVLLVATATLAFASVYAWAYVPMFTMAALIGAAGLWRGGVAAGTRPLAIALAVLCAAAAAQLIPLPSHLLAAISPATVRLLGAYNVAFASGAVEWVPLSIDPRRTAVAVFALVCLSVYVIGLPRMLDPRQLRTVVVALALFAVPFALFGIFTRQYNNGLIYGFWRPLDGGGADQAGPFVNRNHFAGWMLMALSLMIGAPLGYAQRATRGRAAGSRASVPSGEWGPVFLMGVASMVAAIAIFWTISRSAILGSTVAAAAFLVLARARTRPAFNAYRFAAVALTVIVTIAVAWRGPMMLAAWFRDDRNLVGRIDAWRDAWTVITNFPLFGTGLNTYPVAMLFYQTRNPGWFMAQAHNDYLQLLAEGGLLVALPAAVAVAALGWVIARNLKAARSEIRGYWIRAGAAVGLIGIAVQEVFEFSLQIPADALLFATLSAVALAPVVTAPAVSVQRGTRDTIGASTPQAHVALS